MTNDAFLFYNVGAWGKYGLAVPNFSNDTQSQNDTIRYLTMWSVATCRRSCGIPTPVADSAVDQHADADSQAVYAGPVDPGLAGGPSCGPQYGDRARSASS